MAINPKVLKALKIIWIAIGGLSLLLVFVALLSVFLLTGTGDQIDGLFGDVAEQLNEAEKPD